MGATTGFPSVTPAIVVRLDVKAANPHGVVHTGSTYNHYETPSGAIESAPGFEPAFKANVNFGADWCTFDADNQHGRLHLRLVGRVEGSEASISVDYRGVINMDDEVWKVFTMNPEAKSMAFGKATGTASFLVGDEKLKDLEHSVFAGNGRILVTETGLVAETRLCKVIASTDVD